MASRLNEDITMGPVTARSCSTAMVASTTPKDGS